MGKLFGLILIVLLVWVVIEVYDKGMDHAFGGVFAGFSGAEPDSAPQGSLGERFGAKVQSDLQYGAERREEAIEADDND